MDQQQLDKCKQPEDGHICGTSTSFRKTAEFDALYSERLRNAVDIPSRLQALEDYVSDLTKQRDVLIQTVQDLERIALEKNAALARIKKVYENTVEGRGKSLVAQSSSKVKPEESGSQRKKTGGSKSDTGIPQSKGSVAGRASQIDTDGSRDIRDAVSGETSEDSGFWAHLKYFMSEVSPPRRADHPSDARSLGNRRDTGDPGLIDKLREFLRVESPPRRRDYGKKSDNLQEKFIRRDDVSDSSKSRPPKGKLREFMRVESPPRRLDYGKKSEDSLDKRRKNKMRDESASRPPKGKLRQFLSVEPPPRRRPKKSKEDLQEKGSDGVQSDSSAGPSGGRVRESRSDELSHRRFVHPNRPEEVPKEEIRERRKDSGPASPMAMTGSLPSKSSEQLSTSSSSEDKRKRRVTIPPNPVQMKTRRTSSDDAIVDEVDTDKDPSELQAEIENLKKDLRNCENTLVDERRRSLRLERYVTKALARANVDKDERSTASEEDLGHSKHPKDGRRSRKAHMRRSHPRATSNTVYPRCKPAIGDQPFTSRPPTLAADVESHSAREVSPDRNSGGAKGGTTYTESSENGYPQRMMNLNMHPSKETFIVDHGNGGERRLPEKKVTQEQRRQEVLRSIASDGTQQDSDSSFSPDAPASQIIRDGYKLVPYKTAALTGNIECLEIKSDLYSVLELLRRHRVTGQFYICGLFFYTISYHEIFGYAPPATSISCPFTSRLEHLITENESLMLAVDEKDTQLKRVLIEMAEEKNNPHMDHLAKQNQLLREKNENLNAQFNFSCQRGLEYEAEIEKLQNALHASETDRSGLHSRADCASEVTNLQTQLCQLQCYIQQRDDMIKDNSAVLKQKTLEVNSLGREVQKMKHELASKDCMVERLKTRIKELTKGALENRDPLGNTSLQRQCTVMTRLSPDRHFDEEEVDDRRNSCDDVYGNGSGDCEAFELRKSLENEKDLKRALTAEIVEKHDTIIGLKDTIREMEEQLRQSEMQTHFKDDIIRQLRKEVKLGRAKESLAEMLGLKEGPRVQMKARINLLHAELEEKQSEISRLTGLVDSSKTLELESQLKSLAGEMESRDKELLSMCDKIDYIRSYLSRLKDDEQLTIKCGLEALLLELNDDLERNRKTRRNVSISLDRDPEDKVIIINHRSHSLPDTTLKKQVKAFRTMSEMSMNSRRLGAASTCVSFSFDDISRLKELGLKLGATKSEAMELWSSIKTFNVNEFEKAREELNELIDRVTKGTEALKAANGPLDHVIQRMEAFTELSKPNSFFYTSIQSCLCEILENCDSLDQSQFDSMVTFKSFLVNKVTGNVMVVLKHLEQARENEEKLKGLVTTIDVPLCKNSIITLNRLVAESHNLLEKWDSVRKLQDSISHEVLEKLSVFENKLMSYDSAVSIVKSHLDVFISEKTESVPLRPSHSDICFNWSSNESIGSVVARSESAVNLSPKGKLTVSKSPSYHSVIDVSETPGPSGDIEDLIGNIQKVSSDLINEIKSYFSHMDRIERQLKSDCNERDLKVLKAVEKSLNDLKLTEQGLSGSFFINLSEIQAVVKNKSVFISSGFEDSIGFSKKMKEREITHKQNQLMKFTNNLINLLNTAKEEEKNQLMAFRTQVQNYRAQVEELESKMAMAEKQECVMLSKETQAHFDNTNELSEENIRELEEKLGNAEQEIDRLNEELYEAEERKAKIERANLKAMEELQGKISQLQALSSSRDENPTVVDLERMKELLIFQEKTIGNLKIRLAIQESELLQSAQSRIGKMSRINKSLRDFNRGFEGKLSSTVAALEIREQEIEELKKLLRVNHMELIQMKEEVECHKKHLKEAKIEVSELKEKHLVELEDVCKERAAMKAKQKAMKDEYNKLSAQLDETNVNLNEWKKRASTYCTELEKRKESYEEQRILEEKNAALIKAVETLEREFKFRCDEYERLAELLQLKDRQIVLWENQMKEISVGKDRTKDIERQELLEAKIQELEHALDEKDSQIQSMNQRLNKNIKDIERLESIKCARPMEESQVKLLNEKLMRIQEQYNKLRYEYTKLKSQSRCDRPTDGPQDPTVTFYKDRIKALICEKKQMWKVILKQKQINEKLLRTQSDLVEVQSSSSGQISSDASEYNDAWFETQLRHVIG